MNEWILRSAAALGLAVAAAGATHAAQRPETHSEPVSDSRAERVLHDFAACLAASEPRRAREVLALDYRASGYAEALTRLVGSNTMCLERGRLTGNGRLFAGRIAEALLLRSLRGGDLGRRVAFDPARPPLQARDETELMAICTVRAAPAEVAALFASRPASEEENAAVRTLAPRIGGCLAAGTSGRFNRAAIRSMLALAAWRLSELNSGIRTAAGPAG